MIINVSTRLIILNNYCGHLTYWQTKDGEEGCQWKIHRSQFHIWLIILSFHYVCSKKITVMSLWLNFPVDSQHNKQARDDNTSWLIRSLWCNLLIKYTRPAFACWHAFKRVVDFFRESFWGPFSGGFWLEWKQDHRRWRYQETSKNHLTSSGEQLRTHHR